MGGRAKSDPIHGLVAGLAGWVEGFDNRKKEGPAETAISPDHGPTTPQEGTAMDAETNTIAPAGPATGDTWFGRACASDDALRHIGIIASAASGALIQNSSRKGASAEFEITEAALDDATAFLRAIEDIVTQARRAA